MHFIFASVQMFYSFIMVASGHSLAFFLLSRLVKSTKDSSINYLFSNLFESSLRVLKPVRHFQALSSSIFGNPTRAHKALKK